MLAGEEGDARPGRDAGLLVEVRDVCVHGDRGDDQLGGELLLGPAAGEQAQHVDLPVGEPGRPLPDDALDRRTRRRADGADRVGVQ